MSQAEFLGVGEWCGRRGVTFIAEQLVDSEGGYARGPERALLAALLFDGVQAFLNYVAASSEGVKAKYREAYNWITRRGDDYIFDFESVCEALGIDSNYLRLGLINTCVSGLQNRRKNRRTF